MSSKQRSQSTKPEASGGGAPEKKGPSTIAIAIAILGLAVLVFALVVTGDPPERRRRSVAVASDVDRWMSSPKQDVGLTDGDFSIGPEDAPVTLVTFSDFECPYCADASVELSSVYQQFPDDVRIVFKNYPVDQACNEHLTQPGHLYACRAALLARCAGAQDRFWEMHDAIFDLPRLSTSGLEALPEEVGLSEEELAACMEGEEALEAIKADIEAGRRVGVQGTPTIFINGRRAPSQSAEAMAAVVEHILEAETASSDGP